MTTESTIISETLESPGAASAGRSTPDGTRYIDQLAEAKSWLKAHDQRAAETPE